MESELLELTRKESHLKTFLAIARRRKIYFADLKILLANQTDIIQAIQWLEVRQLIKEVPGPLPELTQYIITVEGLEMERRITKIK